MSNLREEVKVPTHEEKKSVFVNILINIINSNDILSSEQIKTRIKGIEKTLSEDEFTAIYSLAVEIKMAIICSKAHKRLFDFLNISEYCRNDNGNLLKFIETTVLDIEETRKLCPQSKWELQVGKIFDRINGKNPYADAIKEEFARRKNIQIVEKNRID